MIFRVFALVLIVIFNIIFQSTLIQEVAIGGISFNLLVITVVSFSLIRGKIEGAIIGFFIGLMQDIFFGSVIGFYTLLYLYLGYFSGFLNRTLYKENILIPIFVIAAGDFILNFFIYIATYLFRGRTDLPYYFLNIILPELVYTVFAAIFIYKLYLLINDKLEFLERRKGEKDKV